MSAGTPPPQIAGKTLAEITAFAKRRARTIFRNRPLQAVRAEIDAKLGLVHFADPVGTLESTALLTKAQGALHYPPRVAITFAYEDSPDARTALAQLDAESGGSQLGGARGLPASVRGQGEVQYRYSYLAARGTDGTIKFLNPNLVDPPSAEALFPLVVEDESFRLFVTIDGKSNKDALDRRAAEIAKKLLDGADDVGGEEGEAVGFFDVTASSVISRVRWEAGPGVVKTCWSVANAAAAKVTIAGRVGSTEVVSRGSRS